jgi:hypothetical protein
MPADSALPGGVPLAAAIRALRAELIQATDAQNQSLRFRGAPVTCRHAGPLGRGCAQTAKSLRAAASRRGDECFYAHQSHDSHR